MLDTPTTVQLHLASGSAQRADLIGLLLARESVVIRPPSDFVEPECESPKSLEDVQQFVQSLAMQKAAAAVHEFQPSCPVLGADTVIVAYDNGVPLVLGKPPEGPAGESVLRRWWCELLSDADHHVVSGVGLITADGHEFSTVVTTRVRFVAITPSMATWYLSTGEASGKAGGYAIQERGSVFVDSIDGSLTNVVGLPLWETANLLSSAGVPVLMASQ